MGRRENKTNKKTIVPVSMRATGTRSEEEIRAFLSDAGFRLRPTMRMRTIRDLAVLSGTA